MNYFAKIDGSNLVTQVTIIDDDEIRNLTEANIQTRLKLMLANYLVVTGNNVHTQVEKE